MTPFLRKIFFWDAPAQGAFFGLLRNGGKMGKVHLGVAVLVAVVFSAFATELNLPLELDCSQPDAVQMLEQATGKAMEKMDLIKDSRRMALLAWQVMNYSHRNNGMLPESIEVLGEVPVDSVNGLPFEYRHGNLEFDKLDDNEKMRFSGFWIAPADPDTEWRRPSICVPLE